MSVRGLAVFQLRAHSWQLLAVSGGTSLAISLMYLALLAGTENHLAAQWILIGLGVAGWFGFAQQTVRLVIAAGLLAVVSVVTAALFRHDGISLAVAGQVGLLVAIIGSLYQLRSRRPHLPKMTWIIVGLEAIGVASVVCATFFAAFPQ
ncbi:MAG: hypothetical protein WC497_01225 [Patescibacteria group bacterium]